MLESALDVANAISHKLGKRALAVRIDGELRDLSAPVGEGSCVEILTFEDEAGKKALWHTASHVMAQAVMRLYPAAKLAIGPAIDTGFYYDFDLEKPFTAEDLEKIEAEMQHIVDANLPLERFELPRNEALALMKDEPYKIELINDLPADAKLSFYQAGRVYRPVRRPARALHGQGEKLQAALHCGRILARQREKQDADARVRHGLRKAGGACGLPEDAQGSARARPQQAGTRAEVLHDQRCGRPGPPAHDGQGYQGDADALAFRRGRGGAPRLRRSCARR